jgi:hypothetical protein
VGRLHARALLQQGPSEWLGPGTALPCPAHSPTHLQRTRSHGAHGRTRANRGRERRERGSGRACARWAGLAGIAEGRKASLCIVRQHGALGVSFFFICALATWRAASQGTQGIVAKHSDGKTVWVAFRGSEKCVRTQPRAHRLRPLHRHTACQRSLTGDLQERSLVVKAGGRTDGAWCSPISFDPFHVQDWIKDLTFSVQEWPYKAGAGKVHTGFLESAASRVRDLARHAPLRVPAGRAI